MATDRLALGSYLRERRARLDPARLGLPLTRRRTPGLRREEVAQRANVSATWYTWLEQGRGGAPSADVLDRIARALSLGAAEREHLFLLAQHRPPAASYEPVAAISPQLQAVLDSLTHSPALIRNSTWDALAWNRAARAVLGDFAAVPVEQRNILRRLFVTPRPAHLPDWEGVARFAVAAFRADTARAGATREAEALAEELRQTDPDFAAIWDDHDVRRHGEATKVISDPIRGDLTLHYAAFGVDAQPDLTLIIYTPAADADRAQIARLMAQLAD